MKQKSIKVLVSFFLAAAVFISVGAFTFAAYGAPTNVTFHNRSDQFVMLPGDNLFPDFAGVMPGAVQEQEITVDNASNEEITLYLRAEPEQAGWFDSKEQQQVSEELVGILQLEITMFRSDSSQKLIYSGPLSGDPGTGGKSSMLEKINLGDYPAGEGARLAAKLQIPKTLGNRYQNAVAKVRWIFSCNITDEIDIPDESIPLDPAPPSSGGEIDIPDESVPLGPGPSPGPGDEIDIPDENIPMGGNPVVTGDNDWKLLVPALLTVLSGTAVVVLMVATKRKKSKKTTK